MSALVANTSNGAEPPTKKAKLEAKSDPTKLPKKDIWMQILATTTTMTAAKAAEKEGNNTAAVEEQGHNSLERQIYLQELRNKELTLQVKLKTMTLQEERIKYMNKREDNAGKVAAALQEASKAQQEGFKMLQAMIAADKERHERDDIWWNNEGEKENDAKAEAAKGGGFGGSPMEQGHNSLQQQIYSQELRNQELKMSLQKERIKYMNKREDNAGKKALANAAALQEASKAQQAMTAADEKRHERDDVWWNNEGEKENAAKDEAAKGGGFGGSPKPIDTEDWKWTFLAHGHFTVRVVNDDNKAAVEVKDDHGRPGTVHSNMIFEEEGDAKAAWEQSKKQK